MLSNRSMAPGIIIPVLSYPDVGKASDWLCGAFGFVERLRIADHRIQLRLGNASVILSLGSLPSDVVAKSKATHSIMVHVEDVADHFQRAKANGAVILHEPQVFPYGEKQYSAEDIGGHIWVFSESVVDVDPADWGGDLIER